MNLIEKLKGVFRKMLSTKSVESALKVTPTISSKMKESLELWEQMYKDESPWLSENVKSMGLASLIASEKARLATIELSVKITGDSERAEFIKTQFDKVLGTIRENLEYGIALGGLIIKPYPVLGPDNKYKIEFSYVKATDFYPLSFSDAGTLCEVAFIDRIVTKDKVYSKLEHHKLVGNVLKVVNLAYVSDNTNVIVTDCSQLGTPISLSSVPEWASLEEETIIENVDENLYAYFKMPLANTVDLDSPLGVSGFSRAAQRIKDADEQYSNLLWEFEGGQLAIDVDRTALNPTKDGKGHTVTVLPKLQDRLFRRNLDLGNDDVYEVFSHELRDQSLINGLNTILMHIEDLCDLARGTISEVTYAEARTATELRILKQRSYSANKDIQTALQKAFEQTIKVIDYYCDLYNIVPEGDYEVAYHWDDSIIVDKDAERQVDLLDVDKGLYSRVEYRMKWRGETKEQALQALKEIDEEKMKAMQLQQSVMMITQQNGGSTTEAAATNGKLNRANESLETTNVESKNE